MPGLACTVELLPEIAFAFALEFAPFALVEFKADFALLEFKVEFRLPFAVRRLFETAASFADEGGTAELIRSINAANFAGGSA